MEKLHPEADPGREGSLRTPPEANSKKSGSSSYNFSVTFIHALFHVI